MASPALVLVAALAFQAPAAPFESKAGGFRIAMPSAPVETSQEVPSDIGPISTHHFQSQKGEVLYIASYSDYPPGVAKDDPAKVLAGAANGAVGGVKGAKLIRSMDARTGQTPGKELEFSYPRANGAQGQGRVQLFLDGSRMYSLTVLGARREVSQAADGFFRSFSLMGSTSPPAAGAADSPTAPAMPKADTTARPGLGNPGVAKRPPGTNRPLMAKAARPPAAGATTGGGAAAPLVSEEHGFRVTFPAKPREQKVTQQSPVGPIDVFVFVLPRAADGVTYLVTATKMPEQVKAADPKSELAGVIDGSVRSTKGTLVSQTDINLGAAPGKEFDFTVPAAGGSTSYSRSRTYFANGRIYQLLVSGPKDLVTGPAGTAFFNSFALSSP